MTTRTHAHTSTIHTRAHTPTRIGQVLLFATLMSLGGLSHAQRPAPDLTAPTVRLQAPERERGEFVPLEVAPTNLKSQAMVQGRTMTGSNCHEPSQAKRGGACGSVHAQPPKSTWAGSNHPASGEQ